ncbi:hypothetical protein IWQ62_001876 [Dispira parvispora]|uniref:G-patch domain-containing protein n=1 Tax=Dispira parvispora TaxID=1520584 RepID=A0A9W8AY07_9FUNG|nr:hypothetical protein IWQ62_001876 [Dispira parvispora]
MSPSDKGDYEEELATYLNLSHRLDQLDGSLHNDSNSRSLQLTKDTFSSPSTKELSTTTQSYHSGPPAFPGFVPTLGDPQYWLHPEWNIWYDVTTGVYSVYDSSTTTYVPIDMAMYTGHNSLEGNPLAEEPLLAQENSVATLPWAPDSSEEITLRLVVDSSETLTPGQVAVLDTQDTSIGRDRIAQGKRLRIPDLATSKYHALIFWQPEAIERSPLPSVPSPRHSSENSTGREEGEIGIDDEVGESDPENGNSTETQGDLTHSTSADPTHGQFYIIDYGSQHGTFVNGERLASPKESSQPHPLGHGDTIEIGTTLLRVHQHWNTRWGCCAQCQLNATNEISLAPGDGLSTSEISTGDVVRQSTTLDLGHTSHGKGIVLSAPATLTAPPCRVSTEPSSALLSESISRSNSSSKRTGSEQRDRLPSRWSSRAPAEFDTSSTPKTTVTTGLPSSIPSTSLPTPTPAAQRMMESMGWSHGQGLGKHHSGRKEAIQVTPRAGKTGLGFKQRQVPTTPLVNSYQPDRIRHLTRQRFYEHEKT